MTRHAMSNADAAWLHMDRPTNRMIINAVLWFDEPLDRETLRDVLAERLVARFPPFGRIAAEHGALGGADWVDDPDFDVDRHLHHVALPAPGDQIALQELVGDLASTPLDRDKPLWEAYLVEGYGAGSALVLRMHHCIADGIALARVMLALTDPEHASDAAVPRAAAPLPGLPKVLPGPLAPLVRGGLGAASALVHEGAELLVHPRRVGGRASEAVADAQALAKLLFAPFDHESAIHGELGPVQHVAWTEPFELGQVKALAHAHGVTINDVLVSAVAGALGRHLAQADGSPQDIHALVPFNLRPADEAPSARLGNHFGLVLLGLPATIMAPVERLAAVHERMNAIKHSREGAVSYGVLGAMGMTPPVVEDRLIDFFSAKASLVLTNVPGPRRPLRLAGIPIAGVLVWAPCAGAISMSVSIFSYNGAVSVGFLVDAGLVPDPDGLAARVGPQLEALAAATL